MALDDIIKNDNIFIRLNSVKRKLDEYKYDLTKFSLYSENKISIKHLIESKRYAYGLKRKLE